MDDRTGSIRREHPILLKIMLFLGFVGLLVAAYQTYEHYFLTSAICDFSANLSCSAVTGSRFGELPANSGIATALWGFIWWAGFLLFTYKLLEGRLGKNREFYYFLYSFFGLLSVAYMLLVELYLLPQETGQVIICPFCTVQHLLIIGIFILSLGLLRRPIRQYINDILFVKSGEEKFFDPKPIFFITILLLIALPGYYILSPPGGQENHFEFAACLAEEGATMYGFDACPHCNWQKNLIGKEAFKKELDSKGYYVRCRPEDEAAKELGESAHRISSVDPLSPTDTQGGACEINVGAGTPTWVINGEKYVGEVSFEELSEATGCELPEGVRG